MGQIVLRWFGIAYVVIGVCGLAFHDAAGNEFGILNVNPLHDVIHTVVGALSIVLSFSASATRAWGWFGFALFALLVVFGIWPQLNLLASAIPVPLDGNVLYFHALSFVTFAWIVAASRRVKSSGNQERVPAS